MATLSVFITCGVIAYQTLIGAITLGGSPRVTRLYLDQLEPPKTASFSFRLIKLITTPVREAIPLAQELVAQTYRETSQRQQQLQFLDLLETIMVYKLPG